MLGDFQFHRLIAALGAYRFGHGTDGVGTGLCNQADSFRLTLRLIDFRHFLTIGSIDGRLRLTLGFLNFRFALTGSQVDLFDFQTFGLGDTGAFFAFRRGLRLHGAQNFLRRHQVFDFVTQHFDAPRDGSLIQCRHHCAVGILALFEGLVHFHPSDNRAQRGLRQLRNRQHIIAGTV